MALRFSLCIVLLISIAELANAQPAQTDLDLQWLKSRQMATSPTSATFAVTFVMS